MFDRGACLVVGLGRAPPYDLSNPHAVCVASGNGAAYLPPPTKSLPDLLGPTGYPGTGRGHRCQDYPRKRDSFYTLL